MVSDKCLEKKIYDRQINKQGMSDRVVDEANPDNYLSTKDIHSLWDDDDLLKEIPDKPWNVEEFVKKCQKLGDLVLAQVLTDLPESLSTSPWTHESLLVDRKEKKLSRTEKRIAERSYEAEKSSTISYSRPSYAAFYPKGPGFRDDGLPDPAANPAKSQNFIQCRKEPWRPPPKPVNEFEPLSHVPARSHPGFNGMGPYPSTSQPLHARPPGSQKRFPIEALARREGVKLQEVLVPRDIMIPTKSQNPIALKAGQRVMLIKTPKGVYLRYRDQIVKIRVPHGLLPFGGSSSGDQSTGNAANPAGSSSTSAGGSRPGSRPGSAEIRKKTTPTPENKPDVVTLSDEDE